MGIETLSGQPGIAAVALALLLGLRHASEPDHLTAVITLVAADEARGTRGAARLGLAWGLGHGTTCLGIGALAIALGHFLPPAVRAAAEVAVGVLIVWLAARLLLRWRDGRLHSHAHRHGALEHAHPHVHVHARHDEAAHGHAHPERLGRSALASFGIGAVHGVGGSALATVLVVAPLSEPLRALALLALFALTTALAMGAASAGLGAALARGPLAPRIEAALPALGGASLLFGLWYTAQAF